MAIRTSESSQGLRLRVSAQRYAMREAVYLLRPADRDRDPAGPIPRLGIAGHIDDRETAEVLLGLDERPVGEEGRAAARVDAAHDGRRVQTAVAEDEDTGDRHLLDQGPSGRAPFAHLLQREVGHPLVVEGDQVQRHLKLLCSRAARTAAPHLLHERARVDTTPRPRLFPSLPHRSRSSPSGPSASLRSGTPGGPTIIPASSENWAGSPGRMTGQAQGRGSSTRLACDRCRRQVKTSPVVDNRSCRTKRTLMAPFYEGI